MESPNRRTAIYSCPLRQFCLVLRYEQYVIRVQEHTSGGAREVERRAARRRKPVPLRPHVVPVVIAQAENREKRRKGTDSRGRVVG